MRYTIPFFGVICFMFLSCAEKTDKDERPNIIFVLADDHRYDAMEFMGHPFLKTPNMNRMAGQGLVFKNAYVTTSLCSPSRASILSGLYAHNHGVVDNYHSVDENLKFFPSYLKDNGYETAFIGKWHMGGEDDSPREGFDYWLSFKGQGTYWADGHGTSREVPQNNSDGFNINGKRVPQKGYITDELTDYAMNWLEKRTADKPFMMYLSHKAIHADFVAADRHLGSYKNMVVPDSTQFKVGENTPMWVINQRNSRHGADFAYNLPDFDINEYYRRYCETILAVDENLGRILEWVDDDDKKEARKTIVVYMGDNGFHFGEHGLIDKRTAYETSVRVPLLMYDSKTSKGRVINEMVANIDIAPTFLDMAGLPVPESMDGRSMKPLMEDKNIPDWRNELLYEYYWERNYPFTPTTNALLTERYKFIRYQGIWDLDEFYDLELDPKEMKNLINSAEHEDMIKYYRQRLFELLKETGGESMPLLEDRGNYYPLRHPEKAKSANFPENYFLKPKKD
ncbi:sulfatase family protein [Arenibacter echinorum]|uniref:Arylsulfatase A-like enzyme n=1 Tax=Arenibacter echinorum TaxID=440515 RepID=A0A327R1U9_9FLAO|nr:sulfatase [Arenibacter echinorum]RAJ10235.1 arylsulfatase A-like enzyme [Arenibacter echinorum]